MASRYTLAEHFITNTLRLKCPYHVIVVEEKPRGGAPDAGLSL